MLKHLSGILTSSVLLTLVLSRLLREAGATLGLSRNWSSLALARIIFLVSVLNLIEAGQAVVMWITADTERRRREELIVVSPDLQVCRCQPLYIVVTQF